MKKVKQEHKQFEIEKLQIMLNAVGFNFDYQKVDLIARTLKVNKPKATIKDVWNVRKEWEKHYENQDLYVEL